eukprot:CAMPEP_0202821762 /NCGR_PEP_ID=MMETSP1389-20130828/10593_1 /ASSEMBLY_ACC=CAM_ASM_000865 /TAXON_ID=302021 /ORGANISM="Rhodomonas sp., Strain CCMP768" /LENGTH=127 /DNA_ID=CAMNT_0049494583 /DNA_START=30 /DNA_END=413 /DNA_ORIENTATION=-
MSSLPSGRQSRIRLSVRLGGEGPLQSKTLCTAGDLGDAAKSSHPLRAGAPRCLDLGSSGVLGLLKWMSGLIEGRPPYTPEGVSRTRVHFPNFRVLSNPLGHVETAVEANKPSCTAADAVSTASSDLI